MDNEPVPEESWHMAAYNSGRQHSHNDDQMMPVCKTSEWYLPDKTSKQDA